MGKSSRDTRFVSTATSFCKLDSPEKAHNFIHSFKLPEYFSNLPNLEHLDLSNNKIQNIYYEDVKVLHQMPLLNLSLDLSLNPLEFIEPGTFKEIKLNGLTLRSNFNSSYVMKTCIQGLAGLKINRLVLGELLNGQVAQSLQARSVKFLQLPFIFKFSQNQPVDF